MLRNRELRRFGAAMAAISAASVAAGLAVGPWAGLLAALSSLAFCAAAFFFTKSRYAAIARLSEQIDAVLHDESQPLIDGSEEGELAILQSEIAKLTLRIREQNEALRRDRERLADAMADIAHQLRTPLTSLNLLLPMLADEAGAATRREKLREARALLERMEWLLNALLKLSRLDAGIIAFAREPVEVDALLRDALRPLLIPMELRGIALRQHVPDGATLLGDAGWLAEAVQNILKNCMDSAGEHGSIEITCEANPLYTAISIRDSGPGIAGEDLPHIFERFYRGRRDGGAGYGIGLALCRSIVVRQGGTVRARNHRQGGAVFELRFPR